MDLLLRNARVLGREPADTFDIGILDGRIVAIEPNLTLDAGLVARTVELDGRLVAPSFVETHIHLDKSCILERCRSEQGTLDEAIAQVAEQKQAFTEADVNARARRTLEKAIGQGTGHMRTHVEVDPVIGLRGLEGVMPLIDEYRWAIDVEICVFPQEGLLNNPGTDELLVAAMKRGVRVVGATPYTDTDPHGHMDIEYVCAVTEKYRYGGRVAVGHVSKLALVDPVHFARIGSTLADTGVAVTVLPATDLYLMGQRGVTPVHKLLAMGVNGSLSSNNILNPFTPFGDASLLRMANLYANICHVGKRDDILECFEMITRRAARLMRRDDYGVEIGRAADLVVIDTTAPEQAVAELPAVMYGFKRGRMTFERWPVTLNRP